jgi:hypothetical protein
MSWNLIELMIYVMEFNRVNNMSWNLIELIIYVMEFNRVNNIRHGI